MRDKKAHGRQQPRKNCYVYWPPLGSLVHTQMLTMVITVVYVNIRLKLEELMRTNKVSL